MKKTLLVVVLGAMITLTTACNTVQGVGKDIQRGGEHVQDAAR